MSTPIPTQTPNVVVSNPSVRKWSGNILGVASLIETIAILVDVSIPQIDYAYITAPAGLIIGGLFGIFQLTVTSPNVPTGGLTATEIEADEQAAATAPKTEA